MLKVGQLVNDEVEKVPLLHKLFKSAIVAILLLLRVVSLKYTLT
jgi:hypothetical protein